MMSDEEADIMLSLLLQVGPARPTNRCHWDGEATGKAAITKMKRCPDCKYRGRAAKLLLQDHSIILDASYYGGVQDNKTWSWLP